MHRCVERFYKVSAPPPPPLDEMLRYYEGAWISQGYESPEEEARLKDYGRQILTDFYNIHQADYRLPVALERLFHIDIEGVKLRGYIDRVDKLASGGLHIIDYKTSQQLFSADYLEQDLQLTFYQMAAEELWKLPVEKLTLYHLRSNTPCTCGPRDAARLNEARRLVVEVAENIAGGKFPATENQFCPCDFPQHCPYYRHQYIDAGPVVATQGVLPGLAAADAIERYAALQAEIKELEAQLDEARQAIVDFCQGQGLSRVFGSEHEITCKLVERTGFSEDEVRALLEPAGLWERALGFDPSRLKQLLADAGVGGDIKKKLEALRRVVGSYHQLRVRTRHEAEEK